jgi:ABC-2 type transport system permease protein
VKIRRTVAVARHDLRVLRSDPMFFVVFATMPLILMAFLKDSFRFALAAHGATNVNGAEQAVPGLTVLFSLFLISSVGFAMFREHGWGTWERLRASSVTAPELLIGKSITPLLQAVVQMAILFVVGGFLYDLRVRGSIVAVALVAVVFALSLVAIGQVLAAYSSSIMQLNAIAYLGAVVLAGIGGALAPLSSLPKWASAVAPVTPSYWAMRGFRASILGGGGIVEVAGSVAVLAGFCVGFGVLAVIRFRVDETKAFFA